MLLLGDRITRLVAVAIVIATAGVLVMSVKPGTDSAECGVRPVAFGVASGAFFRPCGDRVSRRDPVARAGLVRDAGDHDARLGAGLQTAILVAWLGLFDRKALVASFAAWNHPSGAGFLGALASQFWFIGFALTTAANVRTLALIEVVMAQLVSHRFMAHATSGASRREWLLIIRSVGLLLWSQR